MKRIYKIKSKKAKKQKPKTHPLSVRIPISQVKRLRMICAYLTNKRLASGNYHKAKLSEIHKRAIGEYLSKWEGKQL